MSGPDGQGERLQVTPTEQSEELNQDTIEACPECQTESLVQGGDGSEILCEECGLVIEDTKVDRGPEWRAFDSSERERKSRVGAPTTLTMHDKGLTTQIGWRNEDAFGNSISGEKKAQLNRLRTWQERIRAKDSGERNLRLALSEIGRMVSALGLPHSVREEAAVLYRRALEEDLIRGRSIEGVAAGCLYAACRRENLPRSLEEIADVARVDRKEIGSTYRYVKTELGLAMKPVDPKQFVPRYISALELSEEVKGRADTIIEVTADQGLVSGKSPTGYAAAAVYAASLLCNEKRTQQEVADVADVTEVTIRNRYQEQLQAIEDHGLEAG